MPGKNGDRWSNPSHGEDTGENEGLIGYPVLARSPDLARVLTEGLQVFLSTDQRAHLTEGLIGYSFNRIDD